MKIGDKTFLNLQEAVAWLLENNALPYQSTANYAGNTEIALSTLVNPSPAKVRVGSLIFFADSKVSTVIGLTSNSFICSDQYNDLVDDVVYVSNVALNASGHLIVTLSNGDTIDAGLIKQVSSFSIDGSQHLIASYNDGTTTDLGAIFSGNINISGNITATGSISAPSVSGTAVTGDSIIENMIGYYCDLPSTDTDAEVENIYVSVCKNGNKLTFVVFACITKKTLNPRAIQYDFTIPASIGAKLYPYQIGGYDYLDNGDIIGIQKNDFTRVTSGYDVLKIGGTVVRIQLTSTQLTINEPTYLRLEKTFLLSNNFAS